MSIPTPPPIQIQSVTISTDWIEITFLEDRKQTDSVKEATTIAVFARDFPSQVTELHDTLIELVDEAQIAQRNPPKTVRR